MPRRGPTHTITETPALEAALNELRTELGEGEQIDFAELLTLGAEVRTRRHAVERLAQRPGRFRVLVPVRRGYPYAAPAPAEQPHRSEH
jgi:hypothetical protein